MVKRLILLSVLFFIISNLFFSKINLCSVGESKFATNFKLKDIDNKEYIFFDFLGKNLILFFWASWCPSCRRELIDLEKRYFRFKSERIDFLSINVGESKEKIKRFLEKYRFSFPILLDRDYKVSKQYDLLGIPAYILIDKKGEIKFSGYNLPESYLKYFSD